MHKLLGTGDWGLGTGDWGLGTGDWGLGKNFSSKLMRLQVALCTIELAVNGQQSTVARRFGLWTFDSGQPSQIIVQFKCITAYRMPNA
ncbi:hypothetical protein JYQ62_11620 [Nostoc sp. UHCC 0702]|nr:hypothetical protein JYQ62_11620 [Nostoc sp. UHCC 0702]